MMDIVEQSVSQLRIALGARTCTIRDLTQACLDRIDALDKQGPTLNAVIERNQHALNIADQLDTELAAGSSRGPLHGIPILLKDNIATTDGMENTAGSLALVGAKPIRDAFIVTRLIAAGAVILGKTNLSEWANIRSTSSTSGWSGRGGQTVNPYRTDRNPSGSSSGSGVAVAASYAPLAVGTETNGSIVSPASACGVVGLKPTIGLVSRSGIIPISHSQDTAGPMTRSVLDAAILLNVLAADDPADPAVSTESNGSIPPTPGFPRRPADGLTPVDYTATLVVDGLDGARIGILRGAMEFSKHADTMIESAIDVMRANGAHIIDPVEIADLSEIASNKAGLNIMLVEFKVGLAAYLETYTDAAFPIRTIDDIINFNIRHAAKELPYFGQELFELAAETHGLDDPDYIAGTGSLQQRARTGIDTVMDQFGLDAIIAPTGSPATKLDLINGNHHIGGTSTISAIAGYPILSLPGGYAHGMPIGLSFLGRAWSEAILLRLGHAFELAANLRQPPQFLPGSVIPE